MLDDAWTWHGPVPVLAGLQIEAGRPTGIIN